MSEELNQTNQEPTQDNQNAAESDDLLNFEKQSEEEMKALAKGLMVDFVWTLSGLNRKLREKNAETDDSQS